MPLKISSSSSPAKTSENRISGSETEDCQIVTDGPDNAFTLKQRKSGRSIHFTKT